VVAEYHAMTKTELVRQLQECINGEESATAIYLKHLSALMDRSTLPAANIAKVKQTLQELIAMNRLHKETLQNIVARIQQEPDHDY